MLKHFSVKVRGNNKDLNDLKIAVQKMKYNRIMHMNTIEFRELKGIRNSWLPLVLLELYSLTHTRNQLNKRYNTYMLLLSLVRDRTKYSFYIEDFGYIGNNLVIYYKSKESNIEILRQIFSIFNLSLLGD